MAITNLYPNLPGHLVEFKDGGLQLVGTDTASAATKSILILGTAFDGPVNEPVKIDSTTVSQLFGPEVNAKGFPNGATLTKYAKQAFKNGFNDVRCMRVTGSPAEITITQSSQTNEEDKVGKKEFTAEGMAANITIPVAQVATGVLKNVHINDAANETITYYPAIGTSSPKSTAIVLTGGPASNIPKHITLAYQYTYRTYENKTKSITGTDSITNYSTSVTLADPDAGEGIFVEANDTDDDKMSLAASITLADLVVTDDVTSAVLAEGVDYTIDRGSIYFIGTYASAANNVTVTYTMYTDDDSHTGTQSCAAEVDQVLDLGETITGAVSVQVKQPGLSYVPFAASNYTVGTDSITITNAAAVTPGAKFEVTFEYKEYEVVTKAMTVRSIYGGSIYKQATFQIVDGTNAGEKVFVFTKPDSKKYTVNEAPLAYSSDDYPTVGNLKAALAATSINNVFEIYTDDDDIATANFAVFAEAQLTDGGDDGVGVDANTMYQALSGVRNEDGLLTTLGAYQILENYNVDYIYPAGVYADMKQTVNPLSSFHRELALVCAVLTYRTKMTHGFIDVKPNSNTTLVGIQNYVEKLTAYNNIFYMQDENGDDIVDEDGNKMDIGWYTSLVVGPEPVMQSDTLGTYYGSPAIAYAALNASIKAQSSPTNKALPGVKGMKFKFSNKQMNDLLANRMVIFKLKNEGATSTASSTPYVVDGMTAGNPDCDYARMTTVKVVTDVVDQIREVADPFIGEPNTVEQRNALSALISKRLSYLMNQGEITYYSFEINATAQQMLLGECSIALTLVCPTELRKITTVVALRATA